MKYLIIRVAILPLIFITYVSQAQENVVFHHLTSRDRPGADYIQSVFQNSKGFYRIGTATGLQKFDGYNFVVPLKVSKALLPSPVVTESKDGTLWIACERSLFRYNRNSNLSISADTGDKSTISLQVIEDGVGNIWLINKLEDGRLVIVHSSGLLYFHPDSIKIKSPPQDVLLTAIQVMNQSLQVDSISSDHALRLSYDQNFLTIDFVSPGQLNKTATQYFYTLAGLQQGWVNAGTKRVATYTNLSPGNYTFMVRCENAIGIASKNITYLKIFISPPWWLRWWSYMLYGIVLFAIVYYLYRTRIASIEMKQQTAIKAIVATQEEERKRISRDLHDDVGTKLSALKLFVSSLHDKATTINDEEIRSFAKNSENFITEAMQDVKQLLLNLSPTVLEDFGYTTAVEALVNKINDTHKIDFKLVVFGMNERLRKEYELVLYRLTQELINNVLKHAEAKNVALQIGHRDKKIILMIEDDGKGFDIDVHKDGYGLQNLYARTKLMHGSITIDSTPGNGTSVLIEIPYNIN